MNIASKSRNSKATVDEEEVNGIFFVTISKGKRCEQESRLTATTTTTKIDYVVRFDVFVDIIRWYTVFIVSK